MGVLTNGRPPPPPQCTCLFVEGIWRFCPTRQCEGLRVCLCIRLQQLPTLSPPALLFFSTISPSFFRPSFSSCVCVCLCTPPPIRVCDSCSLFAYILSTLHIYKAERFTLNPTPNASRSFPIIILLRLSFYFFGGHFHTIDCQCEDTIKEKYN